MPRMTDESCFFEVPARMSQGTHGPALHVAIVGRDRRRTILDGLAAFPASRVALLHGRKDKNRARRLRDEICAAGIPARLVPAGDGGYMDALTALGELVHEARLHYDAIHVNVSSGTREAGCAAIVACYLHGLQPFHVEMDRPMMLPMLNTSPRERLSEGKTKILAALRHGASHSERSLALGARLDKADLRAHLDGEPGHKGLVDLGLVRRHRRLGLFRGVRLTETGEALLASGLLAGATV